VSEIIHRVDLLVKELLPQDKDSRRLGRIDEDTFRNFDSNVIDTNIKL
jgi:hypothetical protein